MNDPGHFAEIDENGIVLRVIVARQDFIDSGVVGDPSRWIKASYNTKGGVHLLGGVPVRKNYPGRGYFYDSVRDAFIPPQTFPSWALNEETCLWEAPFKKPADEVKGGRSKYEWDEEKVAWIDRTQK